MSPAYYLVDGPSTCHDIAMCKPLALTCWVLGPISKAMSRAPQPPCCLTFVLPRHLIPCSLALFSSCSLAPSSPCLLTLLLPHSVAPSSPCSLVTPFLRHLAPSSPRSLALLLLSSLAPFTSLFRSLVILFLSRDGLGTRQCMISPNSGKIHCHQRRQRFLWPENS